MNPRLSKIKQNILTLYREDKNVVNDDRLLTERYWLRFDGADDSKSLWWNFQKCTNPETLTRRRRELANAGLIEYSARATKRRTDAFLSERDLASSPRTHKAIYVGLDTKS